MAVKDVEMFVEEKRKNETLKKEWDKATKKEAKLKEDKKEAFNEKLYPIVKNMGLIFHLTIFVSIKSIVQSLKAVAGN